MKKNSSEYEFDIVNSKIEIVTLEKLFPILYDERKNLLIDILNRWNINSWDVEEFKKFIEDSKKYDIEVDNSKFSYYYAYVWWAPEPITPLIKSEINNFLALIFNVIDR